MGRAQRRRGDSRGTAMGRGRSNWAPCSLESISETATGTDGRSSTPELEKERGAGARAGTGRERDTAECRKVRAGTRLGDGAPGTNAP
jgi:hypothetical protein